MKRHLFVIPFALPFTWGADYERITATILAERHTVICFLVGEGYSLRTYLTRHTRGPLLTRKKSLYIFKPLYIFPFQRVPAVAMINFFLASLQLRLIAKYLSRKYKIRERIILWIFSLQTAIIPQWFPKQWLKLYDCLDAFTSDVPSLKKIWENRERLILRGVGVVFTNTTTLFERLKLLHACVFRTPAGFDLDTYQKGSAVRTIPHDIIGIPAPRIGFIGNISERIDVRLMDKVIQLLPKYSFVFIGPLDTDYRNQIADAETPPVLSLSRHPNVYLLGNKPRRKLPAYIRSFTAAITPYNISHIFNRYSFPVKTHEYFFVGVPVIATPIPELLRFTPLVKTAQTAEAFAAAVRETVRTPWPDIYRKRQKRLAVGNSWRAKIAYMLKTVDTITNAGTTAPPPSHE